MDLGTDLAGAVVIGHDGSPQPSNALESAIRYAEALKAPLVVARAWHLNSAQTHGHASPGDPTFGQLRHSVLTVLKMLAALISGTTQAFESSTGRSWVLPLRCSADFPNRLGCSCSAPGDSAD